MLRLPCDHPPCIVWNAVGCISRVSMAHCVRPEEKTVGFGRGRHFADHGYGSFSVRYRGSDAKEQRRQLQMFAADIMAKV